MYHLFLIQNETEKFKKQQYLKQVEPKVNEIKRAALGDLGNCNRLERTETLKKQNTYKNDAVQNKVKLIATSTTSEALQPPTLTEKAKDKYVKVRMCFFIDYRLCIIYLLFHVIPIVINLQQNITFT